MPLMFDGFVAIHMPALPALLDMCVMCLRELSNSMKILNNMQSVHELHMKSCVPQCECVCVCARESWELKEYVRQTARLMKLHWQKPFQWTKWCVAYIIQWHAPTRKSHVTEQMTSARARMEMTEINLNMMIIFAFRVHVKFYGFFRLSPMYGCTRPANLRSMTNYCIAVTNQFMIRFYFILSLSHFTSLSIPTSTTFQFFPVKELSDPARTL